MVSLPFCWIYCFGFVSDWESIQRAYFSSLACSNFYFSTDLIIYFSNFAVGTGCPSQVQWSSQGRQFWKVMNIWSELLWIRYVIVLCFNMWLLSLIYCFHVTKFIDWLQILGNYLLKATFWLSGRTVCSVDQHNQLLGKDLALGNKVYVHVGCASINFQWYNLSLRKVLMSCFSCLA